MKILTKDDILVMDDRRVTAVEVPEWGGSVHVRRMSGKARDKFVLWRDKNKDALSTPEGITATKMALLSCTVCDDSGALLFSMDDMVALADKSGTAIDALFEVALDVNGLSSKSQQEIRKNSEGASADTGSVSPVNSESVLPEPSEK